MNESEEYFVNWTVIVGTKRIKSISTICSQSFDDQTVYYNNGMPVSKLNLNKRWPKYQNVCIIQRQGTLIISSGVRYQFGKTFRFVSKVFHEFLILVPFRYKSNGRWVDDRESQYNNRTRNIFILTISPAVNHINKQSGCIHTIQYIESP